MGPVGGFGEDTSSWVGGRMTRGVLIGVGRGAIVEVGRSTGRGRSVVGSSGGTSRPEVRCGSFTSRAMPTSGRPGPSVWLAGSTIDGLGGGTTGSGATGVPMGVGLGFKI